MTPYLRYWLHKKLSAFANVCYSARSTSRFHPATDTATNQFCWHFLFLQVWGIGQVPQVCCTTTRWIAGWKWPSCLFVTSSGQWKDSQRQSRQSTGLVEVPDPTLQLRIMQPLGLMPAAQKKASTNYLASRIISKNEGPSVHPWIPSIVRWQALIDRHLIVALLQTQSLLPSTKNQLKRCVSDGIIHRFFQIT